jgi:DNA polymerase III epsilon subunit-like protein
MKKEELPTTYVVWDLETTGFSPTEDKIIEIGAVKVKDGKVVETKSWLLNHNVFLSDKIVEITHITDELINKEGIEPHLAFTEFIEFFYDIPNFKNITHNGFKFDILFLLNSLPKEFKKPGELIFKNMLDTAVFVKAAKLQMPMYENESFKSWADRVMNVRAFGVKYNIPLCCEELEIDTSDATFHRALGDATLTNKIYEKLCLS